MMDDRNLLNSQETFTRAVQFIWREADMLDRRDYHAWLDLWDPQGHYVVPIDPHTTDFAATLNYAYDDQHMREMRVQRMTSGYLASASDAVRTVSRFTLSSDAADIHLLFWGGNGRTRGEVLLEAGCAKYLFKLRHVVGRIELPEIHYRTFTWCERDDGIHVFTPLRRPSSCAGT
ncbi:MAG TPA: aromatic-ring-hydroxylating dioxygenase subunit beta [Paraburkholderia sp.]